MATEQPTYDLVLLLDPEAEEERRTNILASLEQVIERQGEIVSRHDWGLRPTAYEVRKRGDADYHLLQFHGTSELLRQLDHGRRQPLPDHQAAQGHAGPAGPPHVRRRGRRRRGAAGRDRALTRASRPRSCKRAPQRRVAPSSHRTASGLSNIPPNLRPGRGRRRSRP
jgi:small subunit ribosomal protein S6